MKKKNLLRLIILVMAIAVAGIGATQKASAQTIQIDLSTVSSGSTGEYNYSSGVVTLIQQNGIYEITTSSPTTNTFPLYIQNRL
jgi:hypothetical protein